MIFNSQGDAELRKFINGQTITPGEEDVILPGNAILLGDVIIKAVEEAKPYARELEYIQSSGTQYIDTGFKPNQNTRIEIVYETYGENDGIVGAESDWLSNGFAIFGTALEFGTSFVACNTNDKRKHTAVIDKGVCIVDEATVKTLNGSFSCPFNVLVFTVNRGGVGKNNLTGKVYSCQIYDNGTLVRDFIPVLTHSGEACLYDKVGGRFYYNQGSGSFSYA